MMEMRLFKNERINEFIVYFLLLKKWSKWSKMMHKVNYMD